MMRIPTIVANDRRTEARIHPSTGSVQVVISTRTFVDKDVKSRIGQREFSDIMVSLPIDH